MKRIKISVIQTAEQQNKISGPHGQYEDDCVLCCRVVYFDKTDRRFRAAYSLRY
jgi:hypothetical protein